MALSRTRWLPCALLLVCSIPRSATAAPDEASLDEAPTEVLHQVEPRIEGGVARFTVTRAYESRGARVAELDDWLRLPDGGAAGDVLVDTGRGWSPARLLAAEQAEERYQHLRGQGSAPPTVAVLLSEEGTGTLRLRAFPLVPGARVRLRYTVTAPVRYEEGALVAAYPLDLPAGAQLAPGPTQPGLVVARTGEVLDVRLPVVFEGLRARLGTFAVVPGKYVSSLHLEAAPRLSAPPERANVVFAVDASWSQAEEGIAAQLELVRAYVARVPDASVEVLLVRREAERLFGDFVPASDVPRRLAEVAPARLAPGNGSNLEAGARLAARVLQGRPGPARVLLLTDAQLRGAFSDGVFRETWPEGARVHVVVAGPRAPFALPGRMPDAALERLAVPTGGLVFALGREKLARADARVEELVRPVQVEALALTLRGASWGPPLPPEPLREGEGQSLWRVTDAPPVEVAVEGALWSIPLRIRVAAEPAFSARLPALLVGLGELEGVSPADVAAAARKAGVASPATSFLWAPEGAAPSTLGPAPELGGIEGGVAGGTVGGTIGCGLGSTSKASLQPGAWLAELLVPAAAACGGGEALRDVTLNVETTGREIVDVSALGAPGPAAACLVEAAWALRLDERFSEPHGRYTVAVPARQ